MKKYEVLFYEKENWEGIIQECSIFSIVVEK